MSWGAWTVIVAAIAAAVVFVVAKASGRAPSDGLPREAASATLDAEAESRSRSDKDVAPDAGDDDPLADEGDTAGEVLLAADQGGQSLEPSHADGTHGFFVHCEDGVQADGTWLHTRVLRVPAGPGMASLVLELIAPTLKRGELLRGDVIIDSAPAHGGVLTLEASDVSGRLVVRAHTTHPSERVRAYWRP